MDMLRDLFVPTWPPKWPVGADLLFERVRNVDYMVVSTSILIMGWLYTLIAHDRAFLVLGEWSWNEESIGFQPLYWLVYNDCDPNDYAQRVAAANGSAVEYDSGFSAQSPRSCEGNVGGGYVWEIIWASLVNSMDMLLVNMVNNPWRSKLWAIPAFGVIVFNIVNWGKLVINTTADQEEYDSTTYTISYKAWTAVFAVAWCALLVLLVRLLFFDDFNARREAESVEYTRRLLLSRRPDKTPSMFQDFASGMREACPEEDLTSCAEAAISRRNEREYERLHPEQPPPSLAQMLRQLLRGAPKEQEGQPEEPSASLGTASVGSQVYEEARGTATSSTHRMMTQPVRGGPKKTTFKTLEKLPSLARVFLMLSLLLALFFAATAILGASRLRRAGDDYADKLFQSGSELSRSATESLAMAKDTQATVEAELANLEGYVTTAVNITNALAMQEDQLKQFHALLQDEQLRLVLRRAAASYVGNDTEMLAKLQTLSATADELAAGLTEVNVTQIKANADDLEDSYYVLAGSVRSGLDGLNQLSTQLQDVVNRATEHLHFASRWINELSYSSEVNMVISVLVGLATALGIIEWTRKSWQKLCADIKIGEVRRSPYWKIQTYFHPVKAPSLPGLMASSIAFSFLTVAVVLYIVLEVIWMAGYSGVTIPWAFLQPILFGTGVTLLLKTLLLDRLARLLLTRDGFVTRWAAFSWYVTLMLPFYVITSIVAAVSRFVVLAGVAFVHVAAVHVTLLPPALAAFDPAYIASWSMLLLSHRHNSAVNYTFSNTFTGESMGHDLKNTRAQKNWKVAVTLARNPQLAEMRNHDKKAEVDAGASQKPCSAISSIKQQSSETSRASGNETVQQEVASVPVTDASVAVSVPMA